MKRCCCPSWLLAGLLLLVGWVQSSPDTAINEALGRYHEQYGPLFEYRVVGRDIRADSGLVYLARQTDEVVYPGVIDIMPVVIRGGVWEAALPGELRYGLLWRELPSDVIRALDTSPYKPSADPAKIPRRAYRFPWRDAQWGTVTRSFGSHGRGQIDFDLGGVDVAAAKDGRIVYVNDVSPRSAFDSGAWWYWNTVVIEHGPDEYSLYGHLAPGSVPGWIRAQCQPDVSVMNCDVPVLAGEVIGQEGNTGYSSAPHLHLEFGQAWGLVPYPDMLDYDADGDRLEPYYTAYLYAEHNVAFEGYTPSEVARWPAGTLHQASHGEPLPDGVNLVQNGDFVAGTDGWNASGQINWQVRDGVMRVTRLRTSDPPDWARFYQNLNYGAAARSPFEVMLQLGNDSAIPKTVTVTLRNSAGREYGLLECRFIIEPGTPLQPYRLAGMTGETWANVRLEIGINPPDGAPAVLVDEVDMRYTPGAELSATICLAPA